MNIYFPTNVPALRSTFLFNNISTQISETVQHLATGERIISAKDDPSGLISRTTMRTDIRGIQAAQKNVKATNEFLSTADSGLANISRLLYGDILNADDNGLIGLIYDTTLPTDMKQQQVNDILNLIDSTVQATQYNGKRMLDGSMADGALFQLGKDVQTSMQYRMAMPSMRVTELGGTSGTLYDLRAMTFETDAEKEQAYAIVNEAINMVAKHRGTIGAIQKNVIDSSARNLDAQLEKVTEAEGLISNVDMALESSRLNRAELLAQSAMSSILYAQSFGQYITGLLRF